MAKMVNFVRGLAWHIRHIGTVRSISVHPFGKYLLAVSIVLVAIAVRRFLDPVLETNIPYLTLYPAIMIIAVITDIVPGLVAAVIGLFFAELFFIEPDGIDLFDGAFYLRSSIVLGATLYIGFIGLNLRRALKQSEDRAKAIKESGERYATTLAGIGDAVITTDTKTRIQFMNKVAEKLTGWTFEEAANKPVHEVFRIVSESTRQEKIQAGFWI